MSHHLDFLVMDRRNLPQHPLFRRARRRLLRLGRCPEVVAALLVEARRLSPAQEGGERPLPRRPPMPRRPCPAPGERALMGITWDDAMGEIRSFRPNCFVVAGARAARPWLAMIVDPTDRLTIARRVSRRQPSVAIVIRHLRAAIPAKASRRTRRGGAGKWPAVGGSARLEVDNGREFHSDTFRRTAGLLGIDVQHAPVLDPRHKGTIERLLALWFFEGRLP